MVNLQARKEFKKAVKTLPDLRYVQVHPARRGYPAFHDVLGNPLHLQVSLTLSAFTRAWPMCRKSLNYASTQNAQHTFAPTSLQLKVSFANVQARKKFELCTHTEHPFNGPIVHCVAYFCFTSTKVRLYTSLANVQARKESEREKCAF